MIGWSLKRLLKQVNLMGFSQCPGAILWNFMLTCYLQSCRRCLSCVICCISRFFRYLLSCFVRCHIGLWRARKLWRAIRNHLHTIHYHWRLQGRFRRHQRHCQHRGRRLPSSPSLQLRLLSSRKRRIRLQGFRYQDDPRSLH